MPRPERGEEDIGIEDSPNHVAVMLAGHIGSGKICRSRGLILPPDASSRKLALDKLTGAINTAKDSGDLVDAEADSGARHGTRGTENRGGAAEEGDRGALR
jgi:hypothetical protein